MMHASIFTSNLLFYDVFIYFSPISLPFEWLYHWHTFYHNTIMIEMTHNFYYLKLYHRYEMENDESTWKHQFGSCPVRGCTVYTMLKRNKNNITRLLMCIFAVLKSMDWYSFCCFFRYNKAISNTIPVLGSLKFHCCGKYLHFLLEFTRFFFSEWNSIIK